MRLPAMAVGAFWTGPVCVVTPGAGVSTPVAPAVALAAVPALDGFGLILATVAVLTPATCMAVRASPNVRPTMAIMVTRLRTPMGLALRLEPLHWAGEVVGVAGG